MLRNYKDLKVWQKSYQLCGDLGYMKNVTLDEIKAEVQAIEKMLKALIKSLENKPLTP